jgi:hypothetical protein
MFFNQRLNLAKLISSSKIKIGKGKMLSNFFGKNRAFCFRKSFSKAISFFNFKLREA